MSPPQTKLTNCTFPALPQSLFVIGRIQTWATFLGTFWDTGSKANDPFSSVSLQCTHKCSDSQSWNDCQAGSGATINDPISADSFLMGINSNR